MSFGADVKLIYLPPGEGGTKVGLDDFLALGKSVEDLLSRATSDVRRPSGDSSAGNDSPYRVSENGLAYVKQTQLGEVEVPLTNFAAFIVREIIEDNGTSDTRCLFEIDVTLGDQRQCITVAAQRFPGMSWVAELGAKAIIQPGLAIKDLTRAAIQTLSTSVVRERVHTHTGWRKIDGLWRYLHAGGAIGAEGAVEGIDVRLPEALKAYRLPPPPEQERLVEAIRASLDLLDLAPDHITVPLLAAVYRAAIAPTDFTLHLSGPTGEGKTALAVVFLQHYGATFDPAHLSSWASTANALETLAFLLKDALFVIDDFAPTGTQYDVQRAHREADRLVRAQGNRRGRDRLRSDASLREGNPPRGCTLSTGEDIPRGQSLRARMLVLELPPGALDWQKLTECQREGAAGRYAEALSGFVRWAAGQCDDLRALEAVPIFREQAAQSGQHRRTPHIVAELAFGLWQFNEYALATGAITLAESAALWERGWKALGVAALAQAKHQAASEPTRRFLELAAAALASGRAHVAASHGSEPDSPEAWGWREVVVRTGDDPRQEWRPGGDRIGWIEGDDLYLEPDASFAAVQRLGRDIGDGLTVTAQTLRRRLHERRLLARVDDKRETLLVRKTLEGKQRSVLHLAVSVFTSGQPDKPDEENQDTVQSQGRDAPGDVGFVGSGEDGTQPMEGASAASRTNGDGSASPPPGDADQSIDDEWGEIP